MKFEFLKLFSSYLHMKCRAHRFECTQCSGKYARHSKKGIDIESKVCGKCKGRLEYVGCFNRDGTPMKKKAANGFSLFVKTHFSAVKGRKSQGTVKSHGDTMKELSRLFKNNVVVNVVDSPAKPLLGTDKDTTGVIRIDDRENTSPLITTPNSSKKKKKPVSRSWVQLDEMTFCDLTQED